MQEKLNEYLPKPPEGFHWKAKRNLVVPNIIRLRLVRNGFWRFTEQETNFHYTGAASIASAARLLLADYEWEKRRNQELRDLGVD